MVGVSNIKGVPSVSFNQIYENLALLETDVVSDFMADLATSDLNGHLSNISLTGETLNPNNKVSHSYSY